MENDQFVNNSGFYGDKILYNDFRANILPSKISWKKSCRWGNVMFGHGFDKLVLGLYFFLTHLQEKAKLLLYSTTNSGADTNVCGVFTVVHALSVDEHEEVLYL